MNFTLTSSSPYTHLKLRLKTLTFNDFISIHIFINLFYSFSFYQGQLKFALLLLQCLSLILSLCTSYKFFGYFLLLASKIYLSIVIFPNTANHNFLQIFIFILAILSNPQEDHHLKKQIQLIVLSIYFYAGVQKLLNGQWINGEFLSKVLFNGKNYSHAIRTGTFFQKTLILATEMESVPLDIPVVYRLLIILFSWITILSELLIPIAIFWIKNNRIPILLLLVTQVLIGSLSGEFEFMILALACMTYFSINSHIRSRCLYMLTVTNIIYFVCHYYAKK